VALDWWFLVVVLLVGVYFVYSATAEERFLTREFPEAYPAYKSSTKMLVPFVL
jgi:protein-S-isoprenylcysteine O-methyltransferase Ste14